MIQNHSTVTFQAPTSPLGYVMDGDEYVMVALPSIITQAVIDEEREQYRQAIEEWPPEITDHLEEITARRAAAMKLPAPDYIPPGLPLGMPPMFSEDHLALKLVEQHGASLRYVAIWGKWLSFTAGRWAHENTLAVESSPPRRTNGTPIHLC
jgi:hypothetical protein